MWCEVPSSTAPHPHGPGSASRAVFTFCSCVTSHHKFSGLKQHTRIMAQLPWVRGPGPSQLGPLPSQGAIQLQPHLELGSSSKLAATGIIFSSFYSSNESLSS